MKIGIITEGRAEQKALVELVKHLKDHEVTIVKPVFASIEPKSTAKQIAKASESRINILNSKGCGRIILILDYEDQKECLVDKVRQLEAVYENRGQGHVKVVLKNRQFENWLIADVEAVGKCKNFTVTKAFRDKITPNKADNVANPVGLLSRIKKGNQSFDKRADTQAICKNYNPINGALNSRSFRRFLHLLGHSDYLDQSKNPKIT